MENTLVKSFENTNSNSTDFAVEIADSEDNLEYFRDYTGDKTGYLTYLEGKSFVAITSGTPLEGEYRVIDRTKIGGHS